MLKRPSFAMPVPHSIKRIIEEDDGQETGDEGAEVIAAAKPDADRTADQNEEQTAETESGPHLQFDIQGDDLLANLFGLIGARFRGNAADRAGASASSAAGRFRGDFRLEMIQLVLQLDALLEDLLPGQIARPALGLLTEVLGRSTMKSLLSK